MKRRKNQRKTGKGAPSGLIVSLIVHAAAFFIAGMFVVFTVVTKEEPEFTPPPPVERPKMKLKKPKVKVKKSSTPKPSSRIVAKVKTAKMPDIQIPDLVGDGEGLLEGTGVPGGEIMELPDINSIRLMGTKASTGSDFIGTFYDFNRRRDGSTYGLDMDGYQDLLSDFFNRGWDMSKLEKFYKSREKRYATCFMVPQIPSDLGPEAFGEFGSAGYFWGVHYRGKLVHKDGITFRFRGLGDDVMMVRVDGKLNMAASWPDYPIQDSSGWTSSSGESRVYQLGSNKAEVGDWITLEPGVPLDMEVFIGEGWGGRFSAQLVVEVQGVKYEKNQEGGPILPMFTTAEPSWAMQDAVLEHMVVGEAKVTDCPVFSDF
jgi:hypothetical protein